MEPFEQYTEIKPCRLIMSASSVPREWQEQYLTGLKKRLGFLMPKPEATVGSHGFHLSDVPDGEAPARIR